MQIIVVNLRKEPVGYSIFFNLYSNRSIQMQAKVAVSLDVRLYKDCQQPIRVEWEPPQNNSDICISPS